MRNNPESTTAEICNACGLDHLKNSARMGVLRRLAKRGLLCRVGRIRPGGYVYIRDGMRRASPRLSDDKRDDKVVVIQPAVLRPTLTELRHQNQLRQDRHYSLTGPGR